jgi:hypothetical protein
VKFYIKAVRFDLMFMFIRKKFKCIFTALILCIFELASEKNQQQKTKTKDPPNNLDKMCLLGTVLTAVATITGKLLSG